MTQYVISFLFGAVFVLFVIGAANYFADRIRKNRPFFPNPELAKFDAARSGEVVVPTPDPTREWEGLTFPINALTLASLQLFTRVEPNEQERNRLVVKYRKRLENWFKTEGIPSPIAVVIMSDLIYQISLDSFPLMQDLVHQLTCPECSEGLEAEMHKSAGKSQPLGYDPKKVN